MKWVVSFIVLLILGHGHMFLKLDGPLRVLGLPLWIFYYIFIHLVFVGLLIFYSREINEQDL